MSAVDVAKVLLDSMGYVVLRRESYRKTQERQRVAEALRVAAEEHVAHWNEWVQRDLIPRERMLSDRCTYLYGLAARHGATDEELCPPEVSRG